MCLLLMGPISVGGEGDTGGGWPRSTVVVMMSPAICLRTPLLGWPTTTGRIEGVGTGSRSVEGAHSDDNLLSGTLPEAVFVRRP